MKKISVQAFAKINLSIDVKGVLANGYHIVEMVMQQISLCDNVHISWKETDEDIFEINLSSGRDDLPDDSGNLAYRAAALMGELYPHNGKVTIEIEKNIPVAAGLAGGSSNCAAVIHGLNHLWGLGLSINELNEIGAKLGADVSFCSMGQAAASDSLKATFADDPMASHCALATGTGTELIPLKGLEAHIALSKPDLAVSTAEVYKGIDSISIPARPDNQALILALKEQNTENIYANMINVLENYTLVMYPNVMYTKDKMHDLNSNRPVLMSGSGPTVFAVCETAEQAEHIREQLKNVNRESYRVKTTR